jgi:hypothetical protein
MDGGTVMGSKVFTAGSTVVHPLSSERKALHIRTGQTMHLYIIGDVGRRRIQAGVVFERNKPVFDLSACLYLIAIADVSGGGWSQLMTREARVTFHGRSLGPTFGARTDCTRS